MVVQFNKNDISLQISTFIQRLKRRELSGTYNVGLGTANLLLRFISASRWSSKTEILNDVRALGKNLENAQSQEIVCGNIVRRVLAIIRESYESTDIVAETPSTLSSSAGSEHFSSATNTSSMFELLSIKNTRPSTEADTKKHTKDYKADIIEGIQELIEEIQNIEENEVITSVSFDMIHENEVILIPTPESKTVLKFLCAPAKT